MISNKLTNKTADHSSKQIYYKTTMYLPLTAEC